AGVAIDNAHCADWREGGIAPTAGQAIALQVAMRRRLALAPDRQRSRTLLFLDFDGVLHPFAMPPDAAQLFCHLPRLEGVLRDFPEVQVVISSTWRESRSLAELAALFSPDIACRIIGVSPVIAIRSLADANAVRYREIVQFLEGQDKEEPIKWIALDDDADLVPPHCPNLIQCIDAFGSAEEAQLRQAL
ncbi:MAG: HAD domain-containing protein, partial [Oxalobacteraceae bacterium]